MAVFERLYTIQEFNAFIQQQENTDKLFELIGGEIFEVPSNPYVSKIAEIILTFFNLYIFKNPIGHVTGEAGGYMVSGERYAPDVAFISSLKQPELVKEGYNPNLPDLAVEVVSSESRRENQKLTIKLGNYLAAGVFTVDRAPRRKICRSSQTGAACANIPRE